MVTQQSNTESEINGLVQDSDGKDDQPKAINGIFIERRERRRMCLTTLDGALREHAKIYRALAEGKMSANQAEARSKILGRHSAMLNDRETIKQAQRLANLLEAPQGQPAQLPHYPDVETPNSDT